MTKNIFAAFSILLVSGCATTGSGDFSCSGLPEGVSCKPASELYNEVDKSGYSPSAGEDHGKVNRRGVANNSNLPRSNDGNPRLDQDSKSQAPGDRYFGKVPQVPETDPDQLFILNPPRADGTEPIRQGASQRRIWIAPWVDREGVFHSDQLLFVDISPSGWVNGENLGDKHPIFKPLEN